MTEEWLAERFEANLPHMRQVAFRMLGSRADADDAVQEAWLKLSHTEAGDIENIGGWLTTIVARVSLDMLRTRRSRREELAVSLLPLSAAADPEGEAVLADSVGEALLLLLDTLTPQERLAFVLHDMFDMPFAEIAPIVGRTPAAARQLASRARRRVHGASLPDHDLKRRRQVVDAFLAASRAGDFQALLSLLDPEVTMRADATAVRMGAAAHLSGPAAVAGAFSGRALTAKAVTVDRVPGLVWAPAGRVRVVWRMAFTDDQISEVEMLAHPDTIAKLQLRWVSMDP